MKIPVIAGTIRRRILVNYRVDPEVLRKQLPPRFEPKLHNGHAIAGVCLIRLEDIAPLGMPRFIGLSSENAAHRIAVRWIDLETKEPREGVYIPRRDTSSLINRLAGGHFFPGEHHLANFAATDLDGEIVLDMYSHDKKVRVHYQGTETDEFPATSCFASLKEASDFFEPGSLGYSATKDHERLDGIILKTAEWRISALDTKKALSSYFADESIFPKGSIEFDCALLMRNIAHEWHAAPDLCAKADGVYTPAIKIGKFAR